MKSWGVTNVCFLVIGPNMSQTLILLFSIFLYYWQKNLLWLTPNNLLGLTWITRISLTCICYTFRETHACLMATGDSSWRIDFNTEIRSSSPNGTVSQRGKLVINQNEITCYPALKRNFGKMSFSQEEHDWWNFCICSTEMKSSSPSWQTFFTP